MKKAICTTTIYPPSRALMRFIEIAEKDDWRIFVAGDLKTPHEQYRELERAHPILTYLSPEEQHVIDPELSNVIGPNCIQRRNFAFLKAHKLGAEVFASVDDDNIPMEGWGRDLMLGKTLSGPTYYTDAPCFDPLSATNYPDLWHRGFPLELLSQRQNSTLQPMFVKCDVQADLWNGDPDIDAICRMEHAPHCVFNELGFPIRSNKPSPFNSQNTFLSAAVMPHYCMLPGVGRADDIWPSFHVQAQGFKVVYGSPSVIQERNAQDVMKNFNDELLNYRHNLAIATAVVAGDRNPLSPFLPERARLAMKLYERHFA